MLGFNGGLLGKRRVLNLEVASGLWFQNEQGVAKREGIWPLGITNINVASIAYTQSAIYGGGVANATNANMTDGSFTNTGTATGNPGWVQADLGQLYVVGTVVVGTATANIPGGWSKFYTENCIVEHSLDGSSWTTAFNTGSFAAEGIYSFSVNFTARYVRIRNPNSWLAVSEFYALAPGQSYP
jgi:hypothetical protein